MKKIIDIEQFLDLSDGLQIKIKEVIFDLDVSFRAVLEFNKWLEKYQTNNEIETEKAQQEFFKIIIKNEKQRQSLITLLEKFSLLKIREIFNAIFTQWSNYVFNDIKEIKDEVKLDKEKK